jgi:hypothetical protein
MSRLWLVSALSSVCVLGFLTAHSSLAAETDFKGTWQGRFSSRNHEPVPVTLIINQGVGAKLTGALNLISRCARNADLEVTTDGPYIELAGSDPDGDSITIKGVLDAKGTQLSMTYIVNGSPSGRCETDDGSGTLTKR